MSSGPDFLGIGAQKAGTTWLYANLLAKPGIWMPRVKELHYFDEKAHLKWRSPVMRLAGRSTADVRWRRQLRRRFRAWRRERRRPMNWELRYLFGRPSDDWYLRLFEQGRGRVTGEITPAYMTLAPADVEHVHRLLPEARIILMIRNPIERAWSGSVMTARDTLMTEADVPSVSEIESSRSRLHTDYAGALSNWTAYYPADRIFIGFMEDVARQPNLLLSAICEFLGVDPAGTFKRAEQVVHRGAASAMPAGVAARLAEMYGPPTQELARRFGGYAEFWAFCADRLRPGADGPEEIPYPFWQTGLWQEWLAAGGRPPEGIQSGTLDQVTCPR